MAVIFPLSNYLFHLLFVLWFLTGSGLVGRMGGIVGIGFSIAILLRPGLLIRREKFGGIDPRLGRIWGVGYFAVSLLMITSFQVDTVEKLGLLALILAITGLSSAVMAVRSRILERQKLRTIHFMWVGSSLICVAASLVLIFLPGAGSTPSRLRWSEVLPALLGAVLGLIIALWAERSSSKGA